MTGIIIFLCSAALFVTLIVLTARAMGQSQAKSLIGETYLLAAGGSRANRHR